VRAVENRRYIVRAANTGISAFIRPTGEIRYCTLLGRRATLHGQIVPRNELSFFTRNGDMFAVMCAFVAAGCLLWSLRTVRKPQGGTIG
jgi:apolipoprotein N-acyltransferase